MDKPLVTVIIPNYNYRGHLRDAVESVVMNDHRPVRIVIVDDASTDRSLETAHDLTRYYKMVEVVELKENGGVSHARNEGLRYAKDKLDLVCFLDADDMLTEHSIDMRVEYLQENPTVDVVWGTAYQIRGDVSRARVMKDNFHRIHPSEVNPQTVMYRRKVFEEFGGFYEKLLSAEDKEMSYRLGLHPESPFKGRVECKMIKKPQMAYYRKHPLEKHKRRKADPVWAKETKRIFSARIQQLKKEGITKENTVFPI